MQRNHENRHRYSKIRLLFVLLFLGVLAASMALLTNTVLYSKLAGRRLMCANNMKQLALGIHGYHDEYDALPPPAGAILPPVFDEDVVATASGDWSWRVRILPFIEKQELYDQFRFEEPWDSEHNLTVAETLPGGYHCSSDDYDFKDINGHKIPLTNYVMITGPDTVGPTDGTVRTFSDITDDKSQTLLLVEVWGESRPAWIEPVDITLEDLERGVNSESGKSISGDHLVWRPLFSDDEYGGVNFCFSDCSIILHYDKNMPSPSQLRQMAIINDGEPVEQD
jgi:hypothetical protein